MNGKFAVVLFLGMSFLITPVLAQREAVINVERSQAGNPLPIGGIIWCLICCLTGLNGGSNRNVCNFCLNLFCSYLCCGIPGIFGYAVGYLAGVAYYLLRDLIREADSSSET